MNTYGGFTWLTKVSKTTSHVASADWVEANVGDLDNFDELTKYENPVYNLTTGERLKDNNGNEISYSCKMLYAPNVTGNYWDTLDDKSFSSYSVYLIIRVSSMTTSFDKDSFKCWMPSGTTYETITSIGYATESPWVFVFKVGSFPTNTWNQMYTYTGTAVTQNAYQYCPFLFGYAESSYTPSNTVFLKYGNYIDRVTCFVSTPQVNITLSGSETTTLGSLNITYSASGLPQKTLYLPTFTGSYWNYDSSFPTVATGTITPTSDSASYSIGVDDTYETQMATSTVDFPLALTKGRKMGEVYEVCPVETSFVYTDGGSITGGTSETSAYISTVSYDDGTITDTYLSQTDKAWTPLTIKTVTNNISYLTVNMSLAPSIVSSKVVRVYSHQCKNAVLNNNADCFKVAYELEPAVSGGTSPSLVVFFNDHQQTLSINNSAGDSENYPYQLGPYTTVPYTQGTLFTIQGYALDKFGRKSSEITLPLYDKDGTTSLAGLRAYLYTAPSIIYKGYRCNSSGTAAETSGTYAKLTYTYSFCMLDWKETSNKNGTTQPYVKLSYTGSTSTSTTNLSSTSGSGSRTYSGIATDTSYTFTATLVDPLGATVTTSFYLPTAAVLINFKAGGDGMAVGKWSETSELFDVQWDSRFRGNVAIDGNLTVTGTYPSSGGGASTAEDVTYTAPSGSSLGSNVQDALDNLYSTKLATTTLTNVLPTITTYNNSTLKLKFRWTLIPIYNSTTVLGICSVSPLSTSYFKSGTGTLSGTIALTDMIGSSYTMGVPMFCNMAASLESSSSSYPKGWNLAGGGTSNCWSQLGSEKDFPFYWNSTSKAYQWSYATASTSTRYLWIGGIIYAWLNKAS